MNKYENKSRLRVSAIIFDNGKYLAVEQKVWYKSDELFWSVPGGAVEYLESIEDALKREVLEETGIEIEVIRFVNFHERIAPEKNLHKITLDFLARPVGGKLRPEPGKMNDAAWLTREEAMKLNISDHFRNILEENPKNF